MQYIEFSNILLKLKQYYLSLFKVLCQSDNIKQRYRGLGLKKEYAHFRRFKTHIQSIK